MGDEIPKIRRLPRRTATASPRLNIETVQNPIANVDIPQIASSHSPVLPVADFVRQEGRLVSPRDTTPITILGQEIRREEIPDIIGPASPVARNIPLPQPIDPPSPKVYRRAEERREEVRTPRGARRSSPSPEPVRRVYVKRVGEEGGKNVDPMPHFDDMGDVERGRFSIGLRNKWIALKTSYPNLHMPEYDPGVDLSVRYSHFLEYRKLMAASTTIQLVKGLISIYYTIVTWIAGKVFEVDTKALLSAFNARISQFEGMLVEIGDTNFGQVVAGTPGWMKVAGLLVLETVIIFVCCYFKSPGAASMVTNIVGGIFKGDSASLNTLASTLNAFTGNAMEGVIPSVVNDPLNIPVPGTANYGPV